MASIIKQLNDDDLEHVNNLIRRDALRDLEIAAEIEQRLGQAISETDAGKAAVVYRYRNGKTYRAWLKRYLNRFVEMEKQVRLGQQRYDFALSLVRDSSEGLSDAVSKGLQSRLLALAMEADDEEIRAAMEGKGWIKNLMLTVQREHVLDLKRKQQEQVKAAEDVAGDSSLDEKERRRRIREIFE